MKSKSFVDDLDDLVAKKEHLESQVAVGIKDPDFVKNMQDLAELTPIVEKIQEYKQTRSQISELEEMLDQESDKELVSLMEDEIKELKEKILGIEEEIKKHLVPKDEDEAKNAIIEIRAGTGGDEAAIFAGDLLLMYQRYAEKKGWRFEIMNHQTAERGGCKEAVLLIKGSGAFCNLQFESGVHRVQRVPKTEANGRVHTSAATVAVLPEVEEVDIAFDDKDIKIETCRASGAGGQHVNTTDSAVRAIHIPTGIVVTQQDERSQHQNKQKALKILRARVYAHEKQKRDAARSDDRKQQVGSGDRSEKVRTYNFPQNRITDHRINLTLYNLDNVMAQGTLNPIIEALIADYEATKLKGVGN